MAEEHKKRLLEALDQSDKANSGVVKRGQEFVDSSRLQLDLNQSIRGALEDMADESLSADQWEQWTDGIVAQTVRADIAYRQMEEVQLFTLSTGANVSTASTTASAHIMGHGGAWSVVGYRPAATAAQLPSPGVLRLRDSVQVVFDARDSVSELVGLIRGLGLDVAHKSERTPAEHFEQAALSLRRPAGAATSPTAVLIELREGVDTLLDRLVKRVRVQRPLRGCADKVAFIGEHLGNASLGVGHFERIGASLQVLREDLTQAKGASMAREEVLARFNQVVYVLADVLKALDPARLK